MKKFNEWNQEKDKLKTIIVTCRDKENTLENLLQRIKNLGNIGHSFDIIVDPDGERKKFEWDGDGSDYIKDVKVQ